MILTAYRGEQDEPQRIRRMIQVANAIMEYRGAVIDDIASIHDHKGNWRFGLKRLIELHDMQWIEEMADALFDETQCSWFMNDTLIRGDD